MNGRCTRSFMFAYELNFIYDVVFIILGSFLKIICMDKLLIVITNYFKLSIVLVSLYT